MQKVYQTNVNFGGFYNSIHSVIIDDYIEIMEYDWEKVNYKSTYKIYSEDYIKVLNNKLDTEIIFKELISPKYYNYVTDNIIVELSKKDILKLFKYIKEEELKEEVYNLIKDITTFWSGYIAFYNYKDFFKKDNLDLLLECMLEIIVEHLEEAIIDGLQSNYLEIILNEDIK